MRNVYKWDRCDCIYLWMWSMRARCIEGGWKVIHVYSFYQPFIHYSFAWEMSCSTLH